MLDQVFALAWVKTHVRRFGGDPDRVTISGESGGAGSVMYHGIALEGTLGDLLFRQGIAASPYLPFQYDYDDALPTKRYYTFAKFAGCPGSGDVFDCLVGKDTLTLQVASANVTQTAVHGYWYAPAFSPRVAPLTQSLSRGFWPVTDGSYIVNRPSQQLLTGRVNGRRVLVGHNANEGSFFVPRNITTEADLVNWLSGSEFPNLSPAQIDAILAANPNSAPTDPAGPHFATDGRGTAAAGDTVVQVAPDANGQLQRASNIYAEALFVNLNETGGTPYTTQLYWGPTVTQMAEPGLRNAFGLGSGVTWEGGRKARCDVYLSLADSIPL
jgi:carboxylesterase type B